MDHKARDSNVLPWLKVTISKDVLRGREEPAPSRIGRPISARRRVAVRDEVRYLSAIRALSAAQRVQVKKRRAAKESTLPSRSRRSSLVEAIAASRRKRLEPASPVQLRHSIAAREAQAQIPLCSPRPRGPVLAGLQSLRRSVLGSASGAWAATA
jgi:hypothetical protein